MNLPLEFGGKEIKDSYFKKWKKYHTLKNKIGFKNITGKTTL